MNLISKMVGLSGQPADNKIEHIVENICHLMSVYQPILPQSNPHQSNILGVGMKSYPLMNAAFHQQLANDLKQQIMTYEPRLSHVDVSVENTNNVAEKIYFKIQAVVVTDDGQEPILLDSYLDLNDNRFDIRKVKFV